MSCSDSRFSVGPSTSPCSPMETGLGKTGLKGDKGDPGKKGARGELGLPGLRGPAGRNGTNAIPRNIMKGDRGIPGIPGIPGVSGATTFLELKDTSLDYVGDTHQILRVNATASAVEFTDSIQAGSF